MLEVHKDTGLVVPTNGTNGHGNGNGSGIAIPVVEALAPVAPEQPVATVVETAEAGGEQSASTDSESMGVPENESGAAVETDTATPDPVMKFVFRPWFTLPVMQILLAVLRKINLAELIAGDDPTAKEIGDSPAKLWRKIRRFHDYLVSLGKTTEEVMQFILGTVENSARALSAEGEPSVYDFAKAKAIIEATRLYAYGFLFAIEMGARRELVDRIRANDRGYLWFGPEEVVLEETRVRQEAAQRDEAARRVWETREEARRVAAQTEVSAQAFADEFGGLFVAAEAAGVATTSFVRENVAQAMARRLPEPGDVISSNVEGVIVGKDGGQPYVAGIKFSPLEGSGLRPFLPGKYILGVDRNEGETRESHIDRVRQAFPAGRPVTLQVVIVEQADTRRDQKRSDVLVQIRTAEDLEALRGMKPSFAPPPRKFSVGEEIEGRVIWTSSRGTLVGFKDGSELFAHRSNIAEGLPQLGNGMTIFGRVAEGHGDREFDFRITEIRGPKEDEGERARKQAREEQRAKTVHHGRAEEIRQYVVDKGIELVEEEQRILRWICEWPEDKPVSSDEAVTIDRFLGEILKDADRRFSSVIVTIAQYQRAKENGSGAEEAEDSRPFCRNNDKPEGEWRCERHVAKSGDLCDRCVGRERRAANKAPKPPREKGKDAGCKKCKPGQPCKKHRK